MSDINQDSIARHEKIQKSYALKKKAKEFPVSTDDAEVSFLQFSRHPTVHMIYQVSEGNYFHSSSFLKPVLTLSGKLYSDNDRKNWTEWR